MYQILIIEDDADIVDVVRFYFESNPEYCLTAANSPLEALRYADEQVFDLVLLDIMLPEIDGIDLCRQLRRKNFCPIIFISCLDDDETIVKAFKTGGDDYLVKPFTGPVLLARIEANLRRARGRFQSENATVEKGTLKLDIKTHVARMGEREIYLSPTEFEILYYMMEHAGEILEMEKIYYYIWHQPSYGDVRTISVHISNLRKKIEEDPNDPKHIKTVRRIGYVFQP